MLRKKQPAYNKTEDKINHIYEKIMHTCERKKKSQNALFSFNFLFLILLIAYILILLIGFIMFYFGINPWKISKTTLTCIVNLILFLISAWLGVSSFYQIRLDKIQGTIEKYCTKFEFYISRYRNTVGSVNQMMRDIVKQRESSSIFNFNALKSISKKKQDNESTLRTIFFQFLSTSIVQAGPNNFYACICPICFHHNGIIDKSQIPSLKYECSCCHRTVSFDSEIQKIKVKKEDEFKFNDFALPDSGSDSESI